MRLACASIIIKEKKRALENACSWSSLNRIYIYIYACQQNTFDIAAAKHANLSRPSPHMATCALEAMVQEGELAEVLAAVEGSCLAGEPADKVAWQEQIVDAGGMLRIIRSRKRLQELGSEWGIGKEQIDVNITSFREDLALRIKESGQQFLHWHAGRQRALQNKMMAMYKKAHVARVSSEERAMWLEEGAKLARQLNVEWPPGQSSGQ